MLRQLISSAVLLVGCLFNHPIYAQQCDEKKSSLTPDSRYQILNNAQEVKDLKTGLIWQRCLVGETWNDGQCLGEPEYFSGNEAKNHFVTSTKAWRMPTLDELVTLNSGNCWQPVINLNMFPLNPEYYDSRKNLVSSTPYIPTKQEARITYGQGYRNVTWYWTFSTEYSIKSHNTSVLPTRLVRQ